jgi:shikimate kinase
MSSIRNHKSEIRNLVLIGYRGTGKTTIGRIVAARLGWAFVDADDEIEAAAGCSIAEIFAREGEAGFRERERRVVADLARRASSVVSLGGGAVLRAENRTAIRAGAQVVWLTASPRTIFARLTRDAATAARRPNLTAHGGLAEIEELLAARQPLYRECATLTIDTDGRSADEIAALILESLDS